MHITLSQEEITAAVRQYVAQKGIGAGFSLSGVKFSATRNPAGFSAELVLQETGTDSAPVATIVQAADAVKATTASTVGALVAAASLTPVADAGITTTSEPAAEPVNVEETKSVPEEVVQAAEAPVTEPAPAVESAPALADVAPVNTTSLFG